LDMRERSLPNVNSALLKAGVDVKSVNFIAGLGGRDISKESIREAFHDLREVALGTSKKWFKFLSLGVSIDE